MSFDSPGEAAAILFAEGCADDLCIVPPSDPSPQFTEAADWLGWHGMAKAMSDEAGSWIELAPCLKPSAEQIRAVHQRQAGRGQ